MITAGQLISEKDGYKVNHDAFDNLSTKAKEQILKEYKEWLQDNCTDFQDFDEWVNSWYEDDPEYFKEKHPNWNEEKGEYYVPDGFEDEQEKQEYLDWMKEAFIDGVVESFDCNCPMFAFQSSDYYNMYLFVEPQNRKYKEGAYSLFQASSYCFLSNDFHFCEDEEEEALYSVSPDDYEIEFVTFGKKVLKEYPNADMQKISDWLVENDLMYLMYEAELRDGVLIVGESQMTLVAQEW